MRKGISVTSANVEVSPRARPQLPPSRDPTCEKQLPTTAGTERRQTKRSMTQSPVARRTKTKIALDMFRKLATRLRRHKRHRRLLETSAPKQQHRGEESHQDVHRRLHGVVGGVDSGHRRANVLCVPLSPAANDGSWHGTLRKRPSSRPHCQHWPNAAVPSGTGFHEVRVPALGAARAGVGRTRHSGVASM